MAGITGGGMKAPDLLGAWACSRCHAAVDSGKQFRLEHIEGIMRTQYELIKVGVVKW
jgi:hypothetical protein